MKSNTISLENKNHRFGGTVRAIMGLTGVKNLISKSLGSTNKVNIAYAVLEGLRQQVARKDWTGARESSKAIKSEVKVAKEAPAKATPAKAKKPAAETKKPTATKAKKPAAKKEKK